MSAVVKNSNFDKFNMAEGGRLKKSMQFYTNLSVYKYPPPCYCIATTASTVIYIVVPSSSSAQKHLIDLITTSLYSASYVSLGVKSVQSSSISLQRQRGTPRICRCAPCCGADAADRRLCSNRSTSPGCRAHSSKPAAAACCCRMGQTYVRTDGHPTVA